MIEEYDLEREGYFWAKVESREKPIVVRVWTEVEQQEPKDGLKRSLVRLHIEPFGSEPFVETDEPRLLQRIVEYS